MGLSYLALISALAVANAGDVIVGGSLAKAGQFPYIVSLEISSPAGLALCGGTLINQQQVLTAAHCVNDAAASGVNARSGSLDFRTGGTVYAVEKIRVFPTYDPQALHNDLAILDLSTPVQGAQCASLPAQGSTPATGSMVTTAGWGVTAYQGQVSNELRYVSEPVVDLSTCQKDYEKYINVTTDSFCAGYPEGGKSACQGDSGGPVVQNDTVVGIVDAGVGCAEAKFPDITTRVGAYVDWIMQQKI